LTSRESAQTGGRWRILAHAGDKKVELENEGILDEVVLDDWLHLEQMDERQWWMRVGDARVWINIDDHGRARVDVERGCYEEVRGETKI
jgi:hypothetical protein